MGTYFLILIHVACALALVLESCSKPIGKKIKGEWKAKNEGTTLNITDKQFAMDSDITMAEDYFVKGDTIFTSFEGNQPYSKFIVQQLDEHNLKLLSPDSIVMEFTR